MTSMDYEQSLVQWCEENYVKADDVLEDEDGRMYVVVEGEEGFEKLFYN